jgi:hypothetical protein
MNLYCFKEGYLRLSSEEFTLDETKIEDKFVHLTNNAVQKYGMNYGKHENGNIISFHELQNYFPKDDPKITVSRTKNRIKELIKLSMEAVSAKLNINNRKSCFEIFGYDFLLDTDFNPWIIEVNSNPSIDESNDLLRMLVPRLVDDTFRLTVDKLFVPTTKNYKPEDILREETNLEFPVTGYDDEENLWEYMTNLSPLKNSK